LQIQVPVVNLFSDWQHVCNPFMPKAKDGLAKVKEKRK
jgi:hypothetical protein